MVIDLELYLPAQEYCSVAWLKQIWSGEKLESTCFKISLNQHLALKSDQARTTLGSDDRDFAQSRSCCIPKAIWSKKHLPPLRKKG
jgi:hypothetical protein